MKNTESNLQIEAKPLKTAAIVLALLGAVLSGIVLSDKANYSVFSFSYLLAFIFVWTAVIGCLFFVALHHVTGAVWSVAYRRIAESFASNVGLIFILFIPIAYFTYAYKDFHLYSWMDQHHMEEHPVLAGKLPYLNFNFFAIRAFAFFAIWFLFSRFFVKSSIGQDATVGNSDLQAKNVRMTKKMRDISGPFIILFAYTTSFAGIDWIMSLDPLWFSTMYGVYVFSGVVLTALSVISLTLFSLEKKGIFPKEYLKKDHLYSLGALLFAFSCFWAYIAFSQFMLIWYANIPEETEWFYHRMHGSWLVVTVALALIRFVIPFLMMLSRHAKMNIKMIAAVSIVQLIGQWIDLYWLIMPQVNKEYQPSFGMAEVAPSLLLTGLLLFFVHRFMSKNSLIAGGDPVLDRCKSFHL